MLDGKVEVQTSETERHPIRCYADGKMPNKGLDDEFLTVEWNGSVQSRTFPPGCFKGELALTLYCKTQSDGTVKRNRIRQILRQCQILGSGTAAEGYRFNTDPSRTIMPTTTDTKTGYSMTAIGVEWRTTS